MVAGIGVAAAPAVAMSAVGLWLVARHNRKKLLETKEALLQEALRKRDALSRELQTMNASNHERVEYLSGLLAQLEAAVKNLQADLKLS
jgi:short-subunit dehydrogenase